MSKKHSTELWISSDEDNDEPNERKSNKKLGSKATSDDGGYKKKNTLSLLA